MNRPLSTFPLPATVLSTLREHGFHFYEDLIDRKGIVNEAKDILHQLKLDDINNWKTLTVPPRTVSALDVLQNESAQFGIITWSKGLDDLLGGGVPIGSITEFCGPPGSGKTQICLQLCVDVQIPKCIGGVQGEAVFIDTASGFCPKRLRDMADACSKYCASLMSQLHHPNKSQIIMKSNEILNGTHFVSTHGISQLLAAVKLLPELINQHSKIHLIIVDSLAFPFNSGEPCSTLDRTSYLYRILGDLQKLAEQHSLAVVVTNQLTTRLSGSSADKKSELAPALGESMGHRVNQRVVLGRISADLQAAVLLKGVCSHISSQEAAHFRITSEGIRD